MLFICTARYGSIDGYARSVSSDFTDVYHIGYTMRFPRALGIRDDLTVADCVTATGAFQSYVLWAEKRLISVVVHDSVVR